MQEPQLVMQSFKGTAQENFCHPLTSTTRRTRQEIKERTCSCFFAKGRFNNPIPSFSFLGSGNFWSKDSTSSKSGEAGELKKEILPNWNMIGAPPASKPDKFLISYETQIMILDQARKFSSSSNKKTGEDNSRRIKWPQTKDHTILTWSTNTFTWIGAFDAVPAV